MNALSSPRALLVVIVAAHLIAITVYKIGDALVSHVVGPICSKIFGGFDVEKLVVRFSELDAQGNSLDIRYGEFLAALFGGALTLVLCLVILALFLRLFWRYVVKLMGTDSSKSQGEADPAS